MNRADVITALNNSNLATHMGTLQKAILASATQMILGVEKDEGLSKEQIQKNSDKMLLNMVGPAAASAAVEYAIHACRKKNLYRNVKFNGSFVHNVQLIYNDDDDGFQNFSSVLRQFLLPRYAYLDFDQVVDPRHRVDAECGYPKFITPIMYRYMYDRDDVARRVVDVYPNESWAVDPAVYENEDEDADPTPFEQDWEYLCDNYNMLANLYRLDRLAGIGHYGVLLLGIDDGSDLEKPIDEAELLKGARNSVGKKERKLLYMRPFDEYLSFIHQYETDVMSPRYGLPKFYNLVFLDMTIDAAGASIGTRLNRRVHWSRVVHVADNLMSSLVFGVPRQQPVFNRQLDLRKMKGASAEMLWKAGWPGISFEVDPKFVADNPDFDKEEMREDVADFFNGLQRSLFLQGIQARTLAPTICENPDRFIKIQMEAISSSLEMPLRVFLGAEEGKLASSQDALTWNKRLARRCRLFVAPSIIRNVIDRFIALGIMRPPTKGRYFVDWPDLNSPTNEDKANLSLKWTQALSQYVATGMIHLVQPMDYLTLILGLRPSQAKRIVDSVEAGGGFAKLKAVNPDQGAGVNGKRESIADGTKKAEGTQTI